MARDKKRKRKDKFAKIKWRNPDDLPKMMGVTHDYDRFDLDFIENRDNRLYNDDFDVTDTQEKLYGVPTGKEEIKLKDYLVKRPVPKELMRWRDVPDYHPDSLDMENWYRDLMEYCKNGVWVDGEYWNPYLVYWLNIFVFPVYKLDEDGDPLPDFENMHPYYCNIDRYLFDIIWKAKLTGQDFSLMGGRGIGKSYIAGCVMDRDYRLFPGSLSIVSSTNEATTNEAWSKIDDCLNAVEKQHRALKHKRISDSHSTKHSGEVIELPDGTIEYRGYLSKFEKIVYGKTAGKTRGKRPTLQLFEEFAAFPKSSQQGNLRSCMRESRGSWFVGGSVKKCTVMYTGTGGTVENDEAEDVFLSPKAHNIVPTYDWPEGDRTNAKGERLGTGAFIPTHIKRSGTWEATGCPDVKMGREETEDEREDARQDPVSYMGLLQEYPMTIKEVFMRKGVNIFDQDKIADQRARIEDGEGPEIETGHLNWILGENGRKVGVEWDPSPNGPFSIVEHPHWTLPGIPEEEKRAIKNLYVGGVDSIDQGTADSSVATNNRKGSELAACIKKRILDKAIKRTVSNVYVATYNKRSAMAKTDWDNALKLAVYYNAEMNIEYTKIGIVGHFRDEGRYDLLMKRPTMNLGSADPRKASMLVGTTTATSIIDHQDHKIAEYIDTSYNQIWFPVVLEQMQDYDRENRTKFDFVIAVGLCELADEDLMGTAAKPPRKDSEAFELFGYFTDPVTGYRTYGVIPSKGPVNEIQHTIDLEVEEEHKKFVEHGGMRWKDTSDTDNEQYLY